MRGGTGQRKDPLHHRQPSGRGSGAAADDMEMRVRRPAGRRRGVVRARKLCIVTRFCRLPKLRRHLVEGGRLGQVLVDAVAGPVTNERRRHLLSFCMCPKSRGHMQTPYWHCYEAAPTKRARYKGAILQNACCGSSVCGGTVCRQEDLRLQVRLRCR